MCAIFKVPISGKTEIGGDRETGNALAASGLLQAEAPHDDGKQSKTDSGRYYVYPG
jgi:hypothetical protein